MGKAMQQGSSSQKDEELLFPSLGSVYILGVQHSHIPQVADVFLEPTDSKIHIPVVLFSTYRSENSVFW